MLLLTPAGRLLHVDIAPSETRVTVLAPRAGRESAGDAPATLLNLTLSCDGGAAVLLADGAPRGCPNAALLTVAAAAANLKEGAEKSTI